MPPVAQTTDSTPVNQAINTTVSIVNATTFAVNTPINPVPIAPKPPNSSAQGSPDNGGTPDDKPNSTGDKSNTTDDKQNTAIAKNEPAKKMFCN